MASSEHGSCQWSISRITTLKSGTLPIDHPEHHGCNPPRYGNAHSPVSTRGGVQSGSTARNRSLSPDGSEVFPETRNPHCRREAEPYVEVLRRVPRREVRDLPARGVASGVRPTPFRLLQSVQSIG